MLHSPTRVTAVLIAIALAWYGVCVFSRELNYPASKTFQSREDVWFDLSPHHQIEQTFTLDASYFDSVKFFVFVNQNARPRVPSMEVKLYQSAGKVPIAQRLITLGPSPGTQGIELTFTPEANSQNQKYSLSVESDASPGTLRIWASSYDAYRDGELTINASRTASDLTFFTFSRPPINVLAEKLSFDRTKNAVFILLILIYLGYGLNLILRTRACNSFSVVEKTMWYAALGLVPFPIILSLLNFVLVPVRAGAIQAGIVVLFTTLSAIIIFGFFKPRLGRTAPANWRSDDSVLVILLVLAFVVKLLQIRELLVPNWSDGLQHTMTLLSIFHNSALPRDQIYHIGFHESAFVFNSLVGTSVEETILVFGQVLSLMSGTSLYLLARQLFPEGHTALWSAGCYLFLSLFPDYLVSWGRYPYLIGLTLLPIGSLAILAYFDDRSINSMLISCVIGIALVLCHYGVFVIWALFILCLEMSRTGRPNLSRFALITFMLIAVPVLVLILVSPQILSTLLAAYQRTTFFSRIRQGYATFDSESLYTLGLTTANAHWVVWVLGVLGGIQGLIGRDKRIGFLVLWTALCVTVSLAQEMALGVALPSTVDVVIFAAIPICLLGGYSVNALWSSVASTNEYLAGALADCLLILALASAHNSIGIVNPVTILFREEDQAAMKWISTNTKPGDTFLIGSIAAGPGRLPSDGGGWIYPLAGRKTFYPSRQLSQKGLLAFINIHQISYAYVGAQELSDDLSQLILANPNRFLRVCCSSGIDIYRISSASGSGSTERTR